MVGRASESDVFVSLRRVSFMGGFIGVFVNCRFAVVNLAIVFTQSLIWFCTGLLVKSGIG